MGVTVTVSRSRLLAMTRPVVAVANAAITVVEKKARRNVVAVAAVIVKINVAMKKSVNVGICVGVRKNVAAVKSVTAEIVIVAKNAVVKISQKLKLNLALNLTRSNNKAEALILISEGALNEAAS